MIYKLNPLFPVACEWAYISEIPSYQRCSYYINKEDYNCVVDYEIKQQESAAGVLSLFGGNRQQDQYGQRPVARRHSQHRRAFGPLDTHGVTGTLWRSALGPLAASQSERSGALRRQACSAIPPIDSIPRGRLEISRRIGQSTLRPVGPSVYRSIGLSVYRPMPGLAGAQTRSRGARTVALR